MVSIMRTALIAATVASSTYAGSLADIDHVVLFMQENRAFDHYFGTMAGVRGFKDPNVKINPSGSAFYQQVNSKLSNDTSYLLPWYLVEDGGTWAKATQCMVAGSNGWSANHAAINNGSNDQWAIANTPWSWGHFTRKELPNHFAIAEGWTVGDSYQESVTSSTNPNRVVWLSGTINAPGSPPQPNQGGMYIDNNESPGCEGTNLNCYPLKWTTTPEMYEKAGVSWQVYQDTDNFDDNPLAYFSNFQNAASGSNLQKKGMSFPGLVKFYNDAAAGTLPQVSIIIGPAELSEHPPYQPVDGAWLQQRIVNAVTSSPKYNKTVLMISYDESGGWGDHVVPRTSPVGTTGEWVQDPYGQNGYVPTGPGVRLPFYIISPWTRGGHVYVEPADHNSQIMFVEQWLLSKGKNVTTSMMNTWRRANMANLLKAFNFASPDYSIPNMPNATYPSTDKPGGKWNGYAVCQNTYSTTRPPVPYGKQNPSDALATEQGFKQIRGDPTEGRYLTFESSGYALTNNGAGQLSATATSAAHSSKSQRFVLYANGAQFSIASAVDNSTISATSLKSAGNAPTLYTIKDLGNGAGYTLQSGSQYLIISSGKVTTTTVAPKTGFSVFSVTYDS